MTCVPNIDVVNIPDMAIRQSGLETTPLSLSSGIQEQLCEMNSANHVLSSMTSNAEGRLVKVLHVPCQPDQVDSNIGGSLSFLNCDSFNVVNQNYNSSENLQSILSSFPQPVGDFSANTSSSSSVLKVPVININNESSTVCNGEILVAPNMSSGSVGPIILNSDISTSCNANINPSSYNYEKNSGKSKFSDVTALKTLLSALPSDHNSSVCKKFRPIRPNFLSQFIANINQNVTPTSAKRTLLKPITKKDGISIVNCNLNTLDSVIDNAVITVDDVKLCDLKDEEYILLCDEKDNVGNRSSQDHFFPRQKARIVRQKKKSDTKPLLHKNENASFSFGHNLPGSGKIILNDICIICGVSDTMSEHVVIDNVFCGETGSDTLDYLCKILRIKRNEFEMIGSKLCGYCSELLKEIKMLETNLILKENMIRAAYKIGLKKVRAYEQNSIKKCTEQILDISDLSNHNANESKVSVCVDASHPKRKLCGGIVMQKQHKDFTTSSSKMYYDSEFDEENTGNIGGSGHSLDETNLLSARLNRTTKVKRRKVPRRRRFPCDDCCKSFPCRRSLLAHASSHERGFDCNVCGRYLTTKVRLATHLFKFHGIGEEKLKAVRCDLCDKSFQTKQGLAYHRNVSHQTGSRYECPHCQKVFSYHALFRSHLLFAHGKKKIICETCGDMFFTVSKLNTHINAKHRNAKTWQCLECDVQFTTGTAYRHHNLVKHYDSKFSCDYCDSKFRKKSALFSHMREHNIYACKLCRELFSTEDLLETHMSSVHNISLAKSARRKHISSSHGRKLRPKMSSNDATAETTKAFVDVSSELTRIDLNDILINNSFNNGSTLQMYHRDHTGKLHDCQVGDAEGKISSFGMIEQASELGVPSHSNTLTLGDDVSFINVEILQGLPHNDRHNLSSNDSGHNMPLLDHLERVENISPNLGDNIDEFEGVMHPSLTSDLNSSVGHFQPDVGPDHVVAELVHRAVSGMDNGGPEFVSSIDHLDNTGLPSAVRNMQSSLETMSSELAGDIHALEPCVNDLRSPGGDITSVHELCSVDMETSVDELGAGEPVTGIAATVDLVNSEEIDVGHENQMHSATSEVLQSSSIWLKQNAWAMLKGGSGDQNLASLQNLSNPTMEDLDISVIDADIVSSDVISASNTIDLDVNVADKDNDATLEVLDVHMSD
ncbi:uncharacterized protein LOC108676481 [Hyalella azteca]|uniref:Uncharacterized protein LOC108676481 n=1 Tax=Hyalella azteca TaxID=294128 RepID=A0A8B7P261_HYAAZ|nr:uncharacterized protein LOC108676481 [Hyalella azteca]